MCWSICTSVIGPRPSNARSTGIGTRVVAAEHDRHGPGRQDLAHRLLGARHVALEIMDVGAHVAAIDGADRLAGIERPAEIEVVALEAADHAVAGLPHRRRHRALVVGDVVEAVGRAEGNAEERDVGPQARRDRVASSENRKLACPCFGAVVSGVMFVINVDPNVALSFRHADFCLPLCRRHRLRHDGGGRTERHGLSSPTSTLGRAADRRAKLDGVPRWGCLSRAPPITPTGCVQRLGPAVECAERPALAGPNRGRTVLPPLCVEGQPSTQGEAKIGNPG